MAQKLIKLMKNKRSKFLGRRLSILIDKHMIPFKEKKSSNNYKS